MIYRKPVFAGNMYENDFAKLHKQIIDSYNNKKGPGELPISRKNKKISGVIVPDSPYSTAGVCYSWAYKEIAEHDLPEVYIILGANHSLNEPKFSTHLFSPWEMPFGFVNVNKKLGLALIKKFSMLRNETSAHSNEHSIEIQLPFLQDASKDKLQDLSFIPICISKTASYFDCKKLGQAISQLECNKTVIISSSFLSYGPKFNFNPFKYNVKESVKNINETIFDYIYSFDAEGLWDYVGKSKINLPGLQPLAAGLEYFKLIKASKVQLLSSYYSNEIDKDKENNVCFGSFLFH